ncbi:hypothetical protein AcV5_007360 [Taiwanofungus camphoratus]|nr:hypothetical protein AcV5_007360 [Antrodia cinnamomea]
MDTLPLLATNSQTFRILTTMLNESIGQAFNKVSWMLTLPWSVHRPSTTLEQFCVTQPSPGAHEDGHMSAPHIPLPMHKRLVFSYTGLHSSIERFLHVQNGVVDEQIKHALIYVFQKAAVAQLEEKLALGLQKCQC